MSARRTSVGSSRTRATHNDGAGIVDFFELLEHPLAELSDWPKVTTQVHNVRNSWLNDYVEEVPAWKQITNEVMKSPTSPADMVMRHGSLTGEVQDFFAQLTWAVQGRESKNGAPKTSLGRRASASSGVSFKKSATNTTYNGFEPQPLTIKPNVEALELMIRCAQCPNVSRTEGEGHDVSADDLNDCAMQACAFIDERASSSVSEEILATLAARDKSFTNQEHLLMEVQAQQQALTNNAHPVYNPDSFMHTGEYETAKAHTLADLHSITTALISLTTSDTATTAAEIQATRSDNPPTTTDPPTTITDSTTTTDTSTTTTDPSTTTTTDPADTDPTTTDTDSTTTTTTTDDSTNPTDSTNHTATLACPSRDKSISDDDNCITHDDDKSITDDNDKLCAFKRLKHPDYHASFRYVWVVLAAMAGSYPRATTQSGTPMNTSFNDGGPAFDPSVPLPTASKTLLHKFATEYCINSIHKQVAEFQLLSHGFTHSTQCYEWILHVVKRLVDTLTAATPSTSTTTTTTPTTTTTSSSQDDATIQRPFPVSHLDKVKLRSLTMLLIERVKEAVLHFDDIFLQHIGTGDIFGATPRLETLLELHFATQTLHGCLHGQETNAKAISNELVNYFEQASLRMYHNILHEYSDNPQARVECRTNGWTAFAKQKLTTKQLAQITVEMATRVQLMTRKYQKILLPYLDFQSLIVRDFLSRLCGDAQFLFGRYCELHFNRFEPDEWTDADPALEDRDITRLAASLSALEAKWIGMIKPAKLNWRASFAMVTQGILQRIQAKLCGWCNKAINSENWEPLLLKSTTTSPIKSQSQSQSRSASAPSSRPPSAPGSRTGSPTMTQKEFVFDEKKNGVARTIPIGKALFPGCFVDVVFAMAKTISFANSVLAMLFITNTNGLTTIYSHNKCADEHEHQEANGGLSGIDNNNNNNSVKQELLPETLRTILHDGRNPDINGNEVLDLELLVACIVQLEKVVSNTLHNFVLRVGNRAVISSSDLELNDLNTKMAASINSQLDIGDLEERAQLYADDDKSSTPNGRGSRSSIHSHDSDESYEDAFDITGMTCASPILYLDSPKRRQDLDRYRSAPVSLPPPWNTVNFRWGNNDNDVPTPWIQKVTKHNAGDDLNDLSVHTERIENTWVDISRSDMCMRINAIDACVRLVPELGRAFNTPATGALLSTASENLGGRGVPFSGVAVYIGEIGACLRYRLTDRLVRGVEPVLQLVVDTAITTSHVKTDIAASQTTARQTSAALRIIGRFLQAELFKLSKLLLPSIYEDTVNSLLDWLYAYMKSVTVSTSNTIVQFSSTCANKLHRCFSYIFGVFERSETVEMDNSNSERFNQLLILFQLHTTPTSDLAFLYLRCCHVVTSNDEAKKPVPKAFSSFTDFVAKENSGVGLDIDAPISQSHSEFARMASNSLESIWKSGLVPKTLDNIYGIRSALLRCVRHDHLLAANPDNYDETTLAHRLVTLECSKFISAERLRRLMQRENKISPYGFLWSTPRTCKGNVICDFLCIVRSNDSDEIDTRSAVVVPPNNGCGEIMSIQLQKQTPEEGVGVVVHGPSVTTVDAGTPAARAGLVAGDVLLAINDTDVRHLPHDDIASLLTETRTVEQLMNLDFVMAPWEDSSNPDSSNEFRHAGLEIDLIVERPNEGQCSQLPLETISRPDAYAIGKILVESEILECVGQTKVFRDSKDLFRFSADRIQSGHTVEHSKWNPVNHIPNPSETQRQISQVVNLRVRNDNVARAFSKLLSRFD